MSSKNILSITSFEISQTNQYNQLYPTAKILPEFFKTNLLHHNRIIKIFRGEEAVLRAFYFNYMKLALESKDSVQYIKILQQKFIKYDLISKGKLEDNFMSDFQYRKFLKDFIQIAKKVCRPNFQITANQYPVIEKVLQKLFKTLVSQELSFKINKQFVSEFQTAVQVIKYLCEQFQQVFTIEIPGKCIKFQANQMFLYFENARDIYLAYVEESVQEKSINLFDSSAQDSILCDINEFKLLTQGKQLFQQKQLNLPFDSIQCSQILKNNELDSKHISTSNSKFDEISEISAKSHLLNIKGDLIKRRSKNKSNQIQQNFEILKPKPQFQLSNENINYNRNIINSFFKEAKSEDRQKDSLINILNSRLSQRQQSETILPSNLIEKDPLKAGIIARRKNKVPFINEQTNLQHIETPKNLKNKSSERLLSSIIYEQEHKSIWLQQTDSIKSSQDSFHAKNQSKAWLMLNTPYSQMQKIIEIKQDEDSQFSIPQFCEIECRSLQNSQQTVDLSDYIEQKLVSQKITIKNPNISSTSIGQDLENPIKFQKKNFFNPDSFKKKNSSKLNFQTQIYSKSASQQTKREQNTFQQYMKKMKQNYPFTDHNTNKDYQHFNITQKKMFNSRGSLNYKDNLPAPKINENNKLTDQKIGVSKKESDMRIKAGFEISALAPSGQDVFTKSDILILLDEQYSKKIRAIKNDYCNSLKYDQNSWINNNPKNISQPIKNLSSKSKNQLRNIRFSESIHDIYHPALDTSISRSSETSIYFEKN